MSSTTDTTDRDPLTDGMPSVEVDEACIALRDVDALLRFSFDHTGSLASLDCERDERERVHLLLGMAKEKLAAVLESMNRYV